MGVQSATITTAGVFSPNAAYVAARAARAPSRGGGDDGRVAGWVSGWWTSRVCRSPTHSTRPFGELLYGQGERHTVHCCVSTCPSPGVVMAVAFSSLLFSDTSVLNQFGFMLVVATLVDTFLIRTMLVPALMFCMVEWNWWPGKMPAAGLTDHRVAPWVASTSHDSLAPRPGSDTGNNGTPPDSRRSDSAPSVAEGVEM
jgi:hypothetical protein